MSDSRGVPSADPSPEMVRHHLAATAQRELDALRAELDARLSALEAALAHPDPRTSLEDLVLNLARVATAEAESAAARASLEAQLDAQERAAISVAEAQRALEAERAISHALRVELDQAATALERQREAAGRLRQDVGAVGKSLEAERETRAESVRELERIQDTLQLARDADVARWRQIQQLEVALESERARGAALDAELAAQRDAMVQLSGIRDALQRNLAAAQRAAESRVVDDAGYRAALDTLERRCAELEQHGTAAVAHASDAVRARDALAATLEAERQAASVARVEVDARAGELDSERANADEKWRNAEARATKAMGERDALGHALETERHQTAAALAAAEAHVTKIEAAQANAERSRKDAEVRADEAAAGCGW